MSQTAYSINTQAAFAGQLGDVGLKDAASYTDLTVAVPFGVAVSQGTKDSECKLPAASGDLASGVFLGVSFAQQSNENLVSGSGSYPVGKPVNVLKKGRVWVHVEEAVVVGDPVFVRYASGGGGTQLGAFRKSADTATAAQVSGCRWIQGSNAQGFALLDVDLP